MKRTERRRAPRVYLSFWLALGACSTASTASDGEAATAGSAKDSVGESLAPRAPAAPSAEVDTAVADAVVAAPTPMQLGGDAERAGDRAAAIEHYLLAASQNEAGAADALARLDVVAVRYVEGAPDPVVTVGLPALSDDGSELAFVSGEDHGMSDHTTRHLEIRHLGDNAQRFKEMIASSLEGAGDEDQAALAQIPRERQERVARIGARLATKAPWHPLHVLASEGVSSDLGLVSDDGAVAVRYTRSVIELDLAGAPSLFVRRLPLDLDNYRDQDEDGLDCDIGAVLSEVASDDAKRVVALSFRYDISGVSDMCGAPPGVTRAFVMPSGQALAGWRAKPRERAPTWLARLAEDLPDADRALDDDDRAMLAAFVTRWGTRYPAAPSVKSARARLASR